MEFTNFNLPGAVTPTNEARYILPTFEERTAYGYKRQDPYAKLDQVPVALVVDDEGSTSTETGYENFGDTIADQLIEDG